MSDRKWDDQQWLIRFRDERSREQAFRDLIRFFQSRLYAQVRRMTNSHEDTDDILQETFIKAWTKLDRFREDSQLSTWLYRIAMNETLNHLNKSKRRQGLDESALASGSDSGFTQEEGNELIQKLNIAIEQLPPRQKMIFCYRYFEEMPYAEIAQIMGVSEGSLKASYHHAAQKIELILTHH